MSFKSNIMITRFLQENGAHFAYDIWRINDDPLFYNKFIVNVAKNFRELNFLLEKNDELFHEIILVMYCKSQLLKLIDSNY